MKKNAFFFFIIISGLMLSLIQCTKPADNLRIPPALVHFDGDEVQTYSITTNPAPEYAVNVAVTNVSSEDRTFTYNVTSTTGAVPGTHYNLAGGNTITVPAGQATAQIKIQGIYSAYTTGRKDTLVFTLKEPSLKPASFSDTVKLVLRGPCFDGDISAAELNSLIGPYTRSNDNGFGAWGPYTTTVVSVTQLTATTARAVINNVWDFGFGNVNFILDWTDPNNTNIRVESPTVTSADAGVLNPAYAGLNLVIADHPTPGTASNKFSVCNSRINLRYALGVYDPSSGTILGLFPNVGITTMQR